MRVNEDSFTIQIRDAAGRFHSFRKADLADLRKESGKSPMLGFSRVNRGVAVLDDRVYVGAIDAHLVALDARSGAVRWETEVADHATGHCITAASLAIDGKIIIGISGDEAGIRGFLDACDAKTGQRLWRLWTIPGPGEPGHDST